MLHLFHLALEFQSGIYWVTTAGVYLMIASVHKQMLRLCTEGQTVLRKAGTLLVALSIYSVHSLTLFLLGSKKELETFKDVLLDPYSLILIDNAVTHFFPVYNF